MARSSHRRKCAPRLLVQYDLPYPPWRHLIDTPEQVAKDPKSILASVSVRDWIRTAV